MSYYEYNFKPLYGKPSESEADRAGEQEVTKAETPELSPQEEVQKIALSFISNLENLISDLLDGINAVVLKAIENKNN